MSAGWVVNCRRLDLRSDKYLWWIADAEGDEAEFIASVEETESLDLEHTKAERRATLIAAAPALLEALIAMRDSRPSGASLTAAEGVALDQCCAAIARATGSAA